MKIVSKTTQEAYTTGLQASMSQSALLIECTFAFGKEFERGESSEAARYGSAFHQLKAAGIVNKVRAIDKRPLLAVSPREVANRYGLLGAVEELETHVAAAMETLFAWFGKNEFRIDFEAVRKKGLLVVEQAVALLPGKSGRTIAPHDAEHRYRGLSPGEQPGTLDVAIVPNQRQRRTTPVLVMDHKTGEEDFSRPLDKAQLLSLAAATMRWTGAEEAIVAVPHSRRRGLPKVYADKVKLKELKNYETRVATALGRINDGSMRPGPWCARCPARDICPAQDARLIESASGILTGLTAAGGALSKEGLTANDVTFARVPAEGLSKEKKLGLLYEIAKKSEIMAARVRAEIKAAIVESGGSLLPVTPSHEYLIVREYEKESLSKSSVLEAYGKMAGERMLEKFRKDGAIKKSRVAQLWPEKERGR
jgi:hypothetical protein